MTIRSARGDTLGNPHVPVRTFTSAWQAQCSNEDQVLTGVIKHSLKCCEPASFCFLLLIETFIDPSGYSIKTKKLCTYSLFGGKNNPDVRRRMRKVVLLQQNLVLPQRIITYWHGL
jgi:hypothetical protein